MNDAPEADEPARDQLFVFACAFELSIGFTGLLMGWVFGPDARAYLDRWSELSLRSISLDVAWGIAAAIPTIAGIWLIMKLPWAAIDELKRLGEDSGLKSLLELDRGQLLTISLCSGIGEELAFRGWLFPLLVGATAAFKNGDPFLSADPSALIFAILVSSLLFGVLHPHSRLYVALASLMGVYYSCLLIVTDNLMIPILAHAAHNAVQFLMTKQED